jgi:hypothetical protein
MYYKRIERIIMSRKRVSPRNPFSVGYKLLVETRQEAIVKGLGEVQLILRISGLNAS